MKKEMIEKVLEADTAFDIYKIMHKEGYECTEEGISKWPKEAREKLEQLHAEASARADFNIAVDDFDLWRDLM
ncbi:hypothetical protein [uncultured Pseudoramibacter sp.]|uniref:hypothetical protein n=1 Tax=uncultured Pseudoramibacter sp. TaxID=1623493 RepID=UPI0025EDAC49|nr:hypothetical protein [uncultured Pseudoramibacter sp.]